MSTADSIVVMFHCVDNDAVAEIAKKHLSKLQDQEEDPDAVFLEYPMQFLEDLSKRKGGNRGGKGGISTWSTVDDCAMADIFVTILEPFFGDLLLSFGPYSYRRILVLGELEQREETTVQEIYLDCPVSTRRLRVKHHEGLPFSFIGFRN